MSIKEGDLTTKDMPYLSALLHKELPTILTSKCFNEENLPFYREVVSTELGHLYEHILLEYLCIAKIGMGFKEAIFSGITRWDWNKDPKGTFHIELTLEDQDKIFLTLALKKATNLFLKILSYSEKSNVSSQNLVKPSLQTQD